MDVKFEDLPTSSLELSVRASNLLAREGIETMGQFMKLTDEEIMGWKGSGARTQREIRGVINNLLEDYAMRTGSNEDPPEEIKQALRTLNSFILRYERTVRATVDRAGMITLYRRLA